MMFARYLAFCRLIMQPLNPALPAETRTLAFSLRTATEIYGIVTDPVHGQTHAYQIDDHRSRKIMDDVNVSPILSAPFFSYLNVSSLVYQDARSMILLNGNPHFIRGPVGNNIGGPHDEPGYGCPMASIVRTLTGDNNTDIAEALKEIVCSFDRPGPIHGSVNKGVCLVKILEKLSMPSHACWDTSLNPGPTLSPFFSIHNGRLKGCASVLKT